MSQPCSPLPWTPRWPQQFLLRADLSPSRRLFHPSLMPLKDVRIIQEPESINENKTSSFVSVHHRVVEAGPLHLHGGNQRDLLLLQRVHQPGRWGERQRERSLQWTINVTKYFPGTASGSCASGFGVCCLVTVTCGGSTSVNGTYFQNPGYPSTYDRQARSWHDILRSLSDPFFERVNELLIMEIYFWMKSLYVKVNGHEKSPCF